MRKVPLLMSSAGASFKQDHYMVGGDGSTETYSGYWRGQTFTANKTYLLTYLFAMFRRIGSPGTITVRIRATVGGVPSGGDIASMTFDGNGLVAKPTEFEKVKCVMDVPVQLTNGLKYAIIPTGGTDGSNMICFELDGTSPTYAGGNRVSSQNSGGDWTQQEDDDHLFETWGSV